jgi:hypothetical protein
MYEHFYEHYIQQDISFTDEIGPRIGWLFHIPLRQLRSSPAARFHY